MVASKPARGSVSPGEQWLYNNWDFNVLGTIYERASGRSIYQALFEDIAAPICMQDYHPDDGRYMSGEVSRHPAYHIALTARDMARFGFLYLNDGRWDNKLVLPAGWVAESTTAHSLARRSGYGYLWWTTGHAGEAETVDGVRRNADLPAFRYAAQGHHGQMIYVVPAKRLVWSRSHPLRNGPRTIGRTTGTSCGAPSCQLQAKDRLWIESGHGHRLGRDHRISAEAKRRNGCVSMATDNGIRCHQNALPHLDAVASLSKTSWPTDLHAGPAARSTPAVRRRDVPRAPWRPLRHPWPTSARGQPGDPRSRRTCAWASTG